MIYVHAEKAIFVSDIALFLKMKKENIYMYKHRRKWNGNNKRVYRVIVQQSAIFFPRNRVPRARNIDYKYILFERHARENEVLSIGQDT